MARKPKHLPHRLGFRDDPSRTALDIVEFGRFVFLQHAAKQYPGVLRTLGEIGSVSELPDWADRWGLSDQWCQAYALETWKAWQRHPTMGRTYWMHANDDVEGELVLDGGNGAPVPRPRKVPDHFEWLVDFQVGGRSYADIALGRRQGDKTSVSLGDLHHVRSGCRTTAKMIGLTLRPARRGRPR